jgi:hypothetical protein
VVGACEHTSDLLCLSVCQFVGRSVSGLSILLKCFLRVLNFRYWAPHRSMLLFVHCLCFSLDWLPGDYSLYTLYYVPVKSI